MFKKLIVALALAPGLALASGWADGIYSCNLRAGSDVMPVYVTVNGQPDGRTIFAVAAVQQSMPVHGYGEGIVAGNVFSGVTNYGLPFHIVFGASTLTGTVRLVLDGSPVDAAAACNKIW
jgi:hypothetical protein